MEKPCCIGVVRSADGLKGTESKLGELDTYSTPPQGDTQPMGVIVVHDIFGFQLPNCKYIVDTLAGQGFHAIMADMYDGNRWPSTEFENDDLGTPEFGTWFGTVTTEEFWAGYLKRVGTLAEHLKSKGCTKVGIIGFCWGGMAVAQACASGLVDAGVSLHGAGHNLDQAKAAKCPISFLSVPDDAYFPKENQDAIRDAGFNVKVFDGMYHGFVVRGDHAGKEDVRNAANEAMADTVEFLKKHSA